MQPLSYVAVAMILALSACPAPTGGSGGAAGGVSGSGEAGGSAGAGGGSGGGSGGNAGGSSGGVEACSLDCPTGWTVNSTGVCTASQSTPLALDVKGIAVAGKVTLNGGVPSAQCNPPSAQVLFDDGTRTFRANMSDSSFNFTAAVPPGTYKVSVMDSGCTNLPHGSVQLQSALAVSGPMSNLMLNVSAPTIAGKLTLNGGLPTSQCSPPSTEVLFDDGTQTFHGRVLDSSFNFSAAVPAGTYKVSVSDPGCTNLPHGSIQLQSAFTVSSPVSNLMLNVSAPTVAGKVTLNGGVPSAQCNPPSAQVLFDDGTRTFRANMSDSSFNFTAAVPPGTYKVSVTDSGCTNLPHGSIQLQSAFTVSGPVSNLALNVSAPTIAGKLTLNGGLPTARCSPPSAEVLFDDGTQTFRGRMLDSSFNFSAAVPPGTYRISVSDLGCTSLPQGRVTEVCELLAP
jgi:hypothetical protein